jgi:hypothetical protein
MVHPRPQRNFTESRGSSVSVGLVVTAAMVVGTFHFVSRVDMVSSDVIDMSGAAAQAEISEVVDRLAVYAPTKIVLEMPAADRVAINDHYRAYLAGAQALDAGEREQVGFRLARRLGHAEVFPVDILHRWWEPSVEDVVARDPAAAEVWNELERANASASTEGSDKLHSLTVAEHLALMNDPASQDVMGQYLTVFPRLIDDDDYAGADMTGNWYFRNVRIYANILRITKPGDRLLIFYGAGHVPVLRHLLGASGEYTLDDPYPLLAATG